MASRLNGAHVLARQKLTNYTRRARAQPRSQNEPKNESAATFWLGTHVRFPGLPWALLASLWVHLGSRSGLPLVTPGLPWAPLASLGLLWEVDLGFSCAPLDFTGLPWHLLGCSGKSIWDSPVLPWTSLGSPGFPWASLGGRSGTPLRFPGLPRTLQDAPGRSRTLQDAPRRSRTLQDAPGWGQLGCSGLHLGSAELSWGQLGSKLPGLWD